MKHNRKQAEEIIKEIHKLIMKIDSYAYRLRIEANKLTKPQINWFGKDIHELINKYLPLEKAISKTLTLREKEVKGLERDLLNQSNIARKFGEELQYFQSKKQNVLYEIKLKKYREEILQLKKEVEELKAKLKPKDKGNIKYSDKVHFWENGQKLGCPSKRWSNIGFVSLSKDPCPTKVCEMRNCHNYGKPSTDKLTIIKL